MPQIENASIKVAAVYTAPTGGTTTSLKSLGSNLDSHYVFLDDGAAANLQTTVSWKVNRAKPSATSPSGFTQDRVQVVLKKPKELASGAVVVNTVRFTMAVDIETSDGEVNELMLLTAQLAGKSDFASVYSHLSVS